MSRFLSLFCTVFIVFSLGACTTTKPQKIETNQISTATQKLINLGDSMMQSGDINAALGFYEKATINAPLNEDVAVLYAKNLMLHDLPAAIDYLESVTADIPSPRLYNWYGVALDLGAEHKTAQAIYQNGIDLDPTNISLMNNLGLSLAVTGQTDDARTLFAQVLALEPSNSLYHRNKAIATILGGNAELAKNELANIMTPEDVNDLVATYQNQKGSPLELLRLINGL